MVATYGRDGITPGRVVCLGYDLEANGTRYAYPWLYVVSVVGEIVSGVMFNNDNTETARPSFYGTTFEAITSRNGGVESSVVSHPLSVVNWWPEAVASFLATGTTFPDVTLPSVAPAPVPTLSGEVIPREHVVSRLQEASRIASDYADRNELCGEFERCMEAIGLQDLGLTSLRERERYYRVTYTRETEGTCESCGHEIEETESTTRDLWITARNDDHALDRLLEDMYDDLPGWDGDSSDVYLERL